MDERIDKRLRKKDIVMSEMKSNMRLLWTEVESLTKGRDHLQEHVNHLTKVAKIAKENANREQDILKSENGFLRRQLQLFKGNDNQVGLLMTNLVSTQPYPCSDANAKALAGLHDQIHCM